VGFALHSMHRASVRVHTPLSLHIRACVSSTTRVQEVPMPVCCVDFRKVQTGKFRDDFDTIVHMASILALCMLLKN